MSIPRFSSATLNKTEFLSALSDYGFAIVENVLSEQFCKQVIPELEHAIEQEAKFHGTTDYKDYGMLLACPIYGGSFLTVADNATLMKPFEWVLGDTCIMYVYTSSSMPPHQTNYSARIHVDRPHFIPGFTESMGCLILLDAFTEENGATWILPKSHTLLEAPTEEYFYKNAVRAVAPRGSVLYFNLRIWHAGGQNSTNLWRHCLGIGMIRPYLKQRIDLPRALKNSNTDLTNLSDYGLQKLGFFSQPPISLEEFHAPLEKRTYRQRSEWDKTV